MVTEQKLEYVEDTNLNDHSSSLERSSSHDLVERISFQNLNLVKIIGKGKSACSSYKINYTAIIIIFILS